MTTFEEISTISDIIDQLSPQGVHFVLVFAQTVEAVERERTEKEAASVTDAQTVEGQEEKPLSIQQVRELIQSLSVKVQSYKVLHRVWRILAREYNQQ